MLKHFTVKRLYDIIASNKNVPCKEAPFSKDPCGALLSYKWFNVAEYAWLSSPELKLGEELADFLHTQTTANQVRQTPLFQPVMVA